MDIIKTFNTIIDKRVALKTPSYINYKKMIKKRLLEIKKIKKLSY